MSKTFLENKKKILNSKNKKNEIYKTIQKEILNSHLQRRPLKTATLW